MAQSSPVLTPTGGKDLLDVGVGPLFGPAGTTVVWDSLFRRLCHGLRGRTSQSIACTLLTDSLTTVYRHLVFSHRQSWQSHLIDTRNLP